MRCHFGFQCLVPGNSPLDLHWDRCEVGFDFDRLGLMEVANCVLLSVLLAAPAPLLAPGIWFTGGGIWNKGGWLLIFVVLWLVLLTIGINCSPIGVEKFGVRSSVMCGRSNSLWGGVVRFCATKFGFWERPKLRILSINDWRGGAVVISNTGVSEFDTGSMFLVATELRACWRKWPVNGLTGPKVIICWFVGDCVCFDGISIKSNGAGDFGDWRGGVLFVCFELDAWIWCCCCVFSNEGLVSFIIG